MFVFYILNVGLYTELAFFSLLGLQVCVTTPVTAPPPPLPFLLVCQFEAIEKLKEASYFIGYIGIVTLRIFTRALARPSLVEGENHLLKVPGLYMCSTVQTCTLTHALVVIDF